MINFVKNTVEASQNREEISCLKLARLYEKNFKKKIGKSTIHKILKKNLNYRYMKTTYKTRKIESDLNKLYSFFLIKDLQNA